MRLTESITNGFMLVHRNWQLVLVQIGAMIVSFVGFFILVGLPLAVAFIIFGLDLTELSNIHSMLSTFHRPAEILSRYFGLAVLVLASMLLYLTAVLSLGIFILGGSVGVISRSIRDRAATFSMGIFFSEGRRLFFPLIGFTTVVGLIFLGLAFVLGIFGGAIAAIVSLAREYEATLALFLGIFFSSILFIAGLFLILATLAVTLYGTAAMTVNGLGPVASLKESCRYLHRHAAAFYLYSLVFGGYIVTSFFLLFVGYPLKFIPILGPVLAVFFQFSIHVAQSYLGLVMLATIFWYYSATSGVSESGASGTSAPPTSEGSISGTDTSASQVQTHEEILPVKEPTE